PVGGVLRARCQHTGHGDGVHAQLGTAVGEGEAGGLGREGDRVDQVVPAVGDLAHADEDRGPRVERAHRAVALAWVRTTLPFWVGASTMAPSPSTGRRPS